MSVYKWSRGPLVSDICSSETSKSIINSPLYYKHFECKIVLYGRCAYWMIDDTHQKKWLIKMAEFLKKSLIEMIVL